MSTRKPSKRSLRQRRNLGEGTETVVDTTLAVPDASTPPRSSLWRDGMGRTATRSAQSLLILACAVLVVMGLSRLSTLIIPIVIALIIACAMRPVMVKLKSWGFSDVWATVTALIGLIVVIGGVLTMIVNSVRGQIPELTKQITAGIDILQEWITTLPFQITDEQIDNVRKAALDFVTSANFGSSALSGLSAAGSFLTAAVLMLVVLFFFLKDGPQLWQFVLRPFEGENYARGRRIGTKTVTTLGHYVRGTATVAAIDAIGIGLGLLALGVPLALPLGALTFMLSFIPLIGATIAGVFAVLVALVTKGWVVALVVLALILLIQQIEGNFLQPKIMGSSLQLHPLVIMLALTAGTIIAGILGALLAVPIAAVVWGILSVWDGPDTAAKFVRRKVRA